MSILATFTALSTGLAGMSSLYINVCAPWIHFIGGAVQLTLQVTEPKMVMTVWNYRADVVSKWYPLSAGE